MAYLQINFVSLLSTSNWSPRTLSYRNYCVAWQAHTYLTFSLGDDYTSFSTLNCGSLSFDFKHNNKGMYCKLLLLYIYTYIFILITGVNTKLTSRWLSWTCIFSSTNCRLWYDLNSLQIAPYSYCFKLWKTLHFKGLSTMLLIPSWWNYNKLHKTGCRTK